MKNIKYLVLLVSIIIGIFSCSKGKDAYTEYRVYSSKASYDVAFGKEQILALKFEIPDGAHIYANPKGPGIGKPTTVVTPAEKFFKFDSPRYQIGTRFDVEGSEHVLGYEHETTVFIPFTVLEKTPQRHYTVPMVIEALLCTESTCIPKDVEIEVVLNVLPNGSSIDVLDEELKDEYVKAIKADGGVDKIDENTKKESRAVAKKRLVRLSKEKFSPLYLEKAPVKGILQAILFGLIAGFILNFMPCVLPVVSIKVLSLVQTAGKKKKHHIIIGSLFAGGILFSFTVLAALAAFFGQNWGSLFQNQTFLIAMISIVFAFALSLFGVFTINIPGLSRTVKSSEAHQYSGAFVKGILATLLATPCSGPFLGGTLAWALTQPASSIFLTFFSIGIGMSLPYLILTIKPSYIRFIPKPGNWMIRFEQFMGFFLIFTVLYLFSILSLDSRFSMFAFLCFVGLASWIYGTFGNLTNTKKVRFASLLIIAVVISGGYWVSFSYLCKESIISKMVKKPFSEELIYKNRNNNRISVVKFTADWCPNCKLVEKVALEDDSVQEKLKDLGAELIIADLTSKNAPAQEFLQLMGSYSIPFLVIIPPGKGFAYPICLRDIYSAEDVVTGLERASVHAK